MIDSSSTNLSIIVLSYNPNLVDLFRTLNSIIIQKDVKTKIILCDDGSKNIDKKAIEDWFITHQVENYSLVFNKVNQGTIKNIESGLELVEGPIVKLISPGDFLYSEDTLKIIYQNYLETNFDLCCGDACYYSYDGEIKTYNISNPNKPLKKIGVQNSKYLLKRLVLYRDFILGATFTYKCEELKTMMKKLELGGVKYCEDLSSILFALDKKVVYLDSYLVWYELGSGISTSKKNGVSPLVKNDWDTFFIQMMPKTSKKFIFKLASLFNRLSALNSKLIRRPLLLLIYPYYYIDKVLHKPGSIQKPAYDINKLENLLGD